MLILSSFSFSCSVFKRLVLQTSKNHGLFRKGLKSELFGSVVQFLLDKIKAKFSNGENAGYQHFLLFISTGRRPASCCHGVSVLHPFIHPCMRASVNSSFKKLLRNCFSGFLRNFTGMFLRRSSLKFPQIIVFYEEFWLPWQSKYKTFKNLLPQTTDWIALLFCRNVP